MPHQLHLVHDCPAGTIHLSNRIEQRLLLHQNREETLKPYFDVGIIVPLEEEFTVLSENFSLECNRSTTAHLRLEVFLPENPTRILLVKQATMGRTACLEAALACVTDFDFGVLACVGIAGSLSNDAAIGDVCYSTHIADVLDNAKITGGSEQDIHLSPTWYRTPTSLIIPIELYRVLPETKSKHMDWINELEALGKTLLPGEFNGRNGRETLGPPKILEGTIVCGAVSGNPQYKQKLKGIDRKVLAIETESGGLFSVAQNNNIPAIAIRGICDYADESKSHFEHETGNKARVLAINAVSKFLTHQLNSPQILSYLESRKKLHNDGDASPKSQESQTNETPSSILVRLSNDFNEKLRDLAPGYALVQKGYRLPVPRIRLLEILVSSPEARVGEPIEIHDALRTNQIITLLVPREYPDSSLSWIIASDLITTQIDGKQLVPTVIEANQLQRPRFGIDKLTDAHVLSLGKESSFIPVFLVDDFSFKSKTRVDFLVEQINVHKEAKFIITTRDSQSVYITNTFSQNTSSRAAKLCDIPFLEIANFIRKNFELTAPASEVIAARLHETFDKYSLSAHPSYFAGIPRDTLYALMQANRRAELLDLAVAGYLSFVVAEDTERVALSRTTRQLFLTEFAVSTRIHGNQYTESELAAYVDVFAEKYDYDISAIRFIGAFISQHILYVDGGVVRFTLPFMEDFLLAKYLSQNQDIAKKHFDISSEIFDYRTFSLYAEMGASSEIISAIQIKLDSMIVQLDGQHSETSILLDPNTATSLLTNMERLRSLQSRLESAEEDVRNDRDQSKEKQRLLDASDRVKESIATHATASHVGGSILGARLPNVGPDVEAIWGIGISLLGSGAERLEADVKRDLIKKVVKLSALIIDRWTQAVMKIDFSGVKNALLQNEEIVRGITRSESTPDLREAERLIRLLADLLEYVFILQPFLGTMAYLCEEARDAVLAESISKTNVTGIIEELALSLWLSDIDVDKGRRRLIASISKSPKARFLRNAIAVHLLIRVFWKHWRKEDRLVLLDIADRSLKGMGLWRKTGQLQRLVENLPEADDSLH